MTSYFGWATIFLEWFGAITLMILKKPNLSEPLSQYGYYSSTRLVFGLFFTVVSVVYYLFSKHLDKYWKYTSTCSFIAGIAFIITGWSPYTPDAGTFVMDTHNIALVMSILFFTVPMIGISYAKKHDIIAAFSKSSFLTITPVVVVSLFARATNRWVIYAQIATIIVFHVWLGIIKFLLIKHELNNDVITEI